uniref:recombinase family protein n=1 Tax=Acetatifactor sp. TaxID=1872090 RepID=UPI00402638DF
MTIYEIIKAAISVKQAAKHYGLNVNRNGMACCPFHNDRHPSLKLNEDYFFCFGCGAKGDVIDLVARLFDLSSYEAAQKLAADFGLDPKPPTAAAMVKPKRPYIRQFRENEMLCFRVLTDYLHLLEDWKIRYAPKTPEDALDDRFVEACQMHCYIEYMADVLTVGDLEERVALVDKLMQDGKIAFLQEYITRNHNKFMGYTKNENGDLVIVPEEAEIVRLIFRLYLEGYSAKKISQYLEENGIKTATGQDKWYDSVIFKMLRNEKYMGDALLQKTYTVDFMTKKKVINKGIVPQYYVEDDHEPIIPKELFYRVQEELARRASMNKSAVTRKKNQKSKFSSEYALTGLLLCGDCGQEYRRVTWSRNGKKKIVWRCSNRLTNGTKNCKKSESLEEGALNRAVMEAINRITRGDGDFVGAFRQNVIRVIGSYSGEQEPDEYDEKIKEKEAEMVALITENARVGSYTDEFDERYRRIAEEITILKEEQIETRRKKKLADSYEQRLKDMDSFLEKQTCQIPEFDNDLVRRLIASIKVVSAKKLIIRFQSGIVMEQEIRYE